MIPEHRLLLSSQRWILAELGQQAEKPLWRASWADPDPHQALVHHYFFEAVNLDAARTKVLWWTHRPAHRLPANARIILEYWCSPKAPSEKLPIWRVSWLERKEKHTLFLFEPADRAGVARRARSWARRRRETMEHLEMLQRLGGVQRYQAWFDPDEGQALRGL